MNDKIKNLSNRIHLMEKAAKRLRRKRRKLRRENAREKAKRAGERIIEEFRSEDATVSLNNIEHRYGRVGVYLSLTDYDKELDELTLANPNIPKSGLLEKEINGITVTVKWASDPTLRIKVPNKSAAPMPNDSSAPMSKVKEVLGILSISIDKISNRIVDKKHQKSKELSHILQLTPPFLP